jgi:hypothetical protein
MRLRNRLRYLARRRRLDADLAEELRLHREMAESAALRAGATPEDARREANLAFGSETIALEDSRAVWRFAWIESVALALARRQPTTTGIESGLPFP